MSDYAPGDMVDGKFYTTNASQAMTTLSGSPVLSAYKANSTTQTTTGVTLTVDFDSVTGLNHFRVDTSADGTFYSASGTFQVVITTGTVGGTSVAGAVVGEFTLFGLSSRAPAALVGGRMDASVGAMAGNVLTNAAIQAGAFSNGKFTSDFMNDDLIAADVYTAIWAQLTSAITTSGSIGKLIKDYLTGDAYARLGAPAGASISADIAAVAAYVDTEVAAIYSRLGAPAGASMAADVAAVKTDTGNIYSRQGAPAGASQSADMAAVKIDTAATLAAVDTEVAAILAAVDTEVAALVASLALVRTATDQLAFTSNRVHADVKAINASTAAAAAYALTVVAVATGAAITGTLSSTAMTTNLTEATDSHYVGRVVIWTSGVLAGQASPITAYTGATKLVTYTVTATAEAPSNGDTFVIV